jgi:hypothetical protein
MNIKSTLMLLVLPVAAITACTSRATVTRTTSVGAPSSVVTTSPEVTVTRSPVSPEFDAALARWEVTRPASYLLSYTSADAGGKNKNRTELCIDKQGIHAVSPITVRPVRVEDLFQMAEEVVAARGIAEFDATYGVPLVAHFVENVQYAQAPPVDFGDRTFRPTDSCSAFPLVRP